MAASLRSQRIANREMEASKKRKGTDLVGEGSLDPQPADGGGEELPAEEAEQLTEHVMIQVEQVAEQAPEKEDIDEDELKRQLQDLLDSQLEPREDGAQEGTEETVEGQEQETVTPDYEEEEEPAVEQAEAVREEALEQQEQGAKEEQLEDQDQVEDHEQGAEEVEPEAEEEEEEEEEEPNKGFTSNEIQAFMNNQIRKQHQQHVLEEEMEAQHQMRQQQQPQQHLILVTQNGDKIILIQNPNGEGEEEGETTTATVEYQPHIEIDEQEEIQIQMQHKIRQQMLLLQLDKLREKHRDRPVSTSTGLASKGELMVERAVGDLPDEESKYDDEESMFESLDSCEPQPTAVGIKAKMKPMPSKKVKRKAPKIPKRSGLRVPNWLLPLNANLTLAYNYVKRREDKVDQLGKFFPTTSQSFEKRIEDLRQELLKIELSVERFQNTIGKDLEEVQFKFKSFMKDYHLDPYIGEIEAEDDLEALEVKAEVEEEDDLDCKPTRAKKSRIEAISQTTSCFTPTMQLIAPSSVTVTAAVDPGSDMETSHDFEPEPEIRDEPSDADGEEVEEEDQIEHYEQETVSRSIPLSESGVKPTVSVSQALILKQRPVRSVRLQHSQESDQEASKIAQFKVHPKKGQEPTTKVKRGPGRPPKTPPARASFKCPVVGCSKFFINGEILKDHKETVHGAVGNNLYPCPSPGCTKNFTMAKHLKKHQKAVHFNKKAIFICSVCDVRYKYRKNLENHNLLQHSIHPSAGSEILKEKDVYDFEDKDEEDLEEDMEQEDDLENEGDEEGDASATPSSKSWQIKVKSSSQTPVKGSVKKTPSTRSLSVRSTRSSLRTRSNSSPAKDELRRKPGPASKTNRAPSPYAPENALEPDEELGEDNILRHLCLIHQPKVVVDNLEEEDIEKELEAEVALEVSGDDEPEEEEEIDDNDIIKELKRVEEMSDHSLSPIRMASKNKDKTSKASSSSSSFSSHVSPPPGVLPTGSPFTRIRKEDEISLECRSDCNFSAFDETSNNGTNCETPAHQREGVHSSASSIETMGKGKDSLEQPLLGPVAEKIVPVAVSASLSSRQPKYDSIIRTRAKKSLTTSSLPPPAPSSSASKDSA